GVGRWGRGPRRAAGSPSPPTRIGFHARWRTGLASGIPTCETAAMTHSTCLCGAVTWDADGPLQFMSHCHCSRCRKAHGTPFATYVAAPATGFRLSGRERVGRWESSPGFFRYFCTACGSVVPGDPWEGAVFLPVGCMDSDPGVRPAAHIFVASRAPWFDIHDA